MNGEALSCFDVINRQEIARSEVLTAVPLETSLPECYVVITERHYLFTIPNDLPQYPIPLESSNQQKTPL